MKRIYIVILIIVGGYFVLPFANNAVSSMAFADKPAPWEGVVGLYFPIGASGKAIQSPEFSNLQQCRNWTAGMGNMHRGYGAGGSAEWVCGWGILRYNTKTGLPNMRGFIQSE
jgi:hypothetical protein